MLKIMVNKQVTKVVGDTPCHAPYTDARIVPKFTHNYGEGFGSPKGTTKPGNAGSNKKVK